MRNHIVKFSGGTSSGAVASWVKDHYPTDNVILYFTDTLWEDEDLYRYSQEMSDKLKLPLLIHSEGITPPQLMVKQKFMANNRAGTCSQELKIKVAMRFLKKGIIPPVQKWINRQYLKSEEFVEGATLYYGIGIGELHRAEPIEENWKPFSVSFPLIDHDIDIEEHLKRYDIKKPRMYNHYSHNNCKSRCVKGGKGHFQTLLKRNEGTFNELMEQEIVISEYIRYTKQPAIKKGIQEDYLYKDVWNFVSTGEKSDKIKNIIDSHPYTKNWHFGVNKHGEKINKPFTFMKELSLFDLERKDLQLDFWDMLDIGGCGCAVEFGQCSIE